MKKTIIALIFAATTQTHAQTFISASLTTNTIHLIGGGLEPILKTLKVEQSSGYKFYPNIACSNGGDASECFININPKLPLETFLSPYGVYFNQNRTEVKVRERIRLVFENENFVTRIITQLKNNAVPSENYQGVTRYSPTPYLACYEKGKDSEAFCEIFIHPEGLKK